MKQKAKRKRSIRWYQGLRALLPIIYGGLIFLGIVGQSFIVVAVLMAVALLAGAFYCGWLCPFGYVQEWLGKLGRLLRLPRLRVPKRVEKYLRFTRYVLFGLTFTGLGFALFLDSPYSSFLGAFTGNTAYVTVAAWILLSLFLAASLVVDRPFCRYFCTEGARYGALSLGRLFSIRRDKTRCISCGACDTACPTQVEVSTKEHVRNAQCINCFKCIDSCPAKGALTYGWAFKKGEQDENERTA